MNNKTTIYALGFFDGVHLGHQALLRACRELAEETGCVPGILTFSGHPDTLTKGITPPLINTPADREALLRHFGMEKILCLPFDDKLMHTPWEAFFDMLLDHGAGGIVCGEDFRFGDRGAGNAALLAAACQKADIPCRIVPQQTLGGKLISSSYIRTLLEAGDAEQALRFLGHPHVLTGTVVSGRKLGRRLGIPTANLREPEGTVKLPHGVYACKALCKAGEFMAVTNIGSRPTVGGHHVTVEPWLLDFEGDLYGESLQLLFYRFLRPEQTFPDLESLRKEIMKNAREVRNFFEKGAK